MKAITVRQPWAWAIIHAGKDVENRTRNLAGTYRGPLAIHASKTCLEDDFYDVQDLLPDDVEIPHRLAYGCVIGVVNLLDVHYGSFEDGCPSSTTLCSPWAVDGAHHLVLATPRPLPIPSQYPGRLGLWDLPAHLLRGVQ